MIVNHNLMSFMSNLCIKSNFDIFPGATNNNDNNTNINKKNFESRKTSQWGFNCFTVEFSSVISFSSLCSANNKALPALVVS